MISVDFFNRVLAFLTFVSHIFLVAGLLFFVFFPKNKTNPFFAFFGRNGILFAFFVAFFASALSLFYSNIIGFPPCNLCWYQRIFLYPQVIILGLACLKKDSAIIDYALVLTFIGGLIAIYHTYIDFGGTSLFPCSASGLASCTQRYVFEFGYITIPVMSLTSFLLLFFFLFFQKYYQRMK